MIEILKYTFFSFLRLFIIKQIKSKLAKISCSKFIIVPDVKEETKTVSAESTSTPCHTEKKMLFYFYGQSLNNTEQNMKISLIYGEQREISVNP